MSEHHGEPAAKDRQRQRPALRRPHDEGPGGVEHRPIRAVGAGAGRLLPHRGARPGRLPPGGCVRRARSQRTGARRAASVADGAIVFGSDQGLVGQFNETVADHAIARLATLPGATADLGGRGAGPGAPGRRAACRWPASSRCRARCTAIAPLVGQILVEAEAGQRPRRRRRAPSALQPPAVRLAVRAGQSAAAAAGRAVARAPWRHDPWPTTSVARGLWAAARRPYGARPRISVHLALPGVCRVARQRERQPSGGDAARRREHRRAARRSSTRTFHRLRQSGIDEELFDVVAGFEALGGDSSA